MAARQDHHTWEMEHFKLLAQELAKVPRPSRAQIAKTISKKFRIRPALSKDSVISACRRIPGCIAVEK